MAPHRLSDRQRAAREREFNREAPEREEQLALQDRRAARRNNREPDFGAVLPALPAASANREAA
jgi:hypothetical protein